MDSSRYLALPELPLYLQKALLSESACLLRLCPTMNKPKYPRKATWLLRRRHGKSKERDKRTARIMAYDLLSYKRVDYQNRSCETDAVFHL
jgi:hypothetical protein